MAKKEIPEHVLNKLMSGGKEPAIAELRGSGPFQLPLLTKLVSVVIKKDGTREIRLATQLGQEVRVPIAKDALALLIQTVGKSK